MKYMKSLILGLLLVMFASPLATAQQFDTNRMNRDLNIMENILSEMFKTQTGNSEYNRTISMISRSVRGTYMPGFGVIFMVNNNTNRFPITVQSSSDNNVSFYYTSDEDDSNTNTVDEASVTARMKEFLKNYASTIGQLKPAENVVVIYGKAARNEFTVLRSFQSGKVTTEKQKALPVISVSASTTDLQDYRSGKLSESAFEKRLNIAKAEGKEYLDLKVMSNIFETALKDRDADAFRLSGSVDYLMLENFGVLFSFDVRISSSTSYSLARSLRFAEEIVFEQGAPKSDDKDAKTKEEIVAQTKEAYNQLKKDLKEYLVDYGRTINSIKSNQYILTTVTIDGRNEGVPNRIDVQLKKAVLEDLDKGTITRAQALNKVIVTEY
mgnify:CR=1 FL=1|tara:strand:- start:12675 stop:13820 length:1146 start_codon:yes stop_codon:yes gene_type:complete